MFSVAGPGILKRRGCSVFSLMPKTKYGGMGIFEIQPKILHFSAIGGSDTRIHNIIDRTKREGVGPSRSESTTD